MDVLVPEGAVFDYQLFKRAGTFEGATTDEILQRRKAGRSPRPAAAKRPVCAGGGCSWP